VIAWASWKSDEAISRREIASWCLLGTGASLLLIWWSKEALATVAAVLGFAGVTDLAILTDHLPDGPSRVGELRKCPRAALDTDSSGRINETAGAGGAPMRATASTDFKVLYRFPAGCTLDFEGYCIGQSVTDLGNHAPNRVWYLHKDKQDGSIALIPGAEVLSTYLKPGTNPSKCPGQQPGPKAPTLIRLHPRVNGQTVTLAAAASYTEIVGLAMNHEEIPGDRQSRRWHRVSVDTSFGDGFALTWDARSVVHTQHRFHVWIAVVPCYALDFPSRKQSIYLLTVAFNGRHPRAVARGRRRSDLAFGPQSRKEARREACRGPGA
jgi:hypothetical protein